MALANITNNILTDTGVNVSSLTPTSTTISTTAPLQGGGDLSANRTLSITQSGTSANGFLSSTDWNTFNNKQAAGNYMTSLTGEATGTGPGATAVTLNNASVTAKVLTGVNITGGTVVATDSILTAFGKLQNQINGLIGSSVYQGTWNAATNTPALASGVGTRGYYYIVSVAGTTNLDGITDWFVGDWAIFDGTAWQQVDNTDAVVSVNGQTGAVSLTTDNISEGATNQYFLNSRARAALSFTAGSGAYNSTTGVITIPTNTSQLTNGANFITLASLSGTAPIQYNNTTGAISITQAGTASNGFLSSTDWNTFNNKQSALTNPVTGTGTTNYLPKFTGTSTIGDSNILIQGGGFYLAGSEIFTNANGGIFFNGNGSYATGIFGYSTSNNIRVIAPNQIDFYTSGSEQMRLDASGNLSIAQGNAPTQVLNLYRAGSTQTVMAVGNSNTGLNGTYFGVDANGNGIMNTTGAFANIFSTNGSERMRLTSSGNLGLGTTSPSVKLQVVGDGSFSGFVNANVYNLAGLTGGGALSWTTNTLRLGQDSYFQTLQFWTNGSEKMRLDASGNLGIGSSPIARLTVVGTGNYNVLNETLASDAVIWSSEMTNDQYNSILQLVSVRQSLSTGAASQGFLGFSTVDDSNAQGIRDAGRIAIVNEIVNARNSATALSFWTNAGGTNTTAATEKVRITSGGNLGIGTTAPSYKLQSNASSYQLALINPGYGGWLYNVGTDLSMGFVLEGTGEKMRLTSAGDLLIGDTTASANLWVKSSASGNTFGARNTNATFAATVGFFGADRNTTNNSFYYIDCYNYGSSSYRFRVADSGAVTSASSVTATIFDSTSNAFRFSGNNALSLVSLGGQSVVKINAAGYWGTQLVGANDQGILINNNGRVGVGTTNISVFRLNVSGHYAADTSSYPTDGAGDSYRAGIGWQSFANDANVLSTLMTTINDGNYGGHMVFLNRGTNGGNLNERMRIASNGNVGIGTTNPSTAKVVIFQTGGTQLNLISGDSFGTTDILLRLTSSNDYRGRGIWMDNSGTTGAWYAGVPYGGGGYSIGYDATQPEIYANSKLLISTTGAATFSSTIQNVSAVYVRASSNSDLPFINFSNADGAYNWGRVGGLLQGDGDGALYFQTKLGGGLTEKMRITSGGNVGIGTTAPSYKLQVNGSEAGLYVMAASVSPFTQTIATFIYGGNNNSINIENHGGKASIQARDGSGSVMDLHLNPAGGNVGIGLTSPQTKLNVNKDFSAGSTQRDFLRLTASQPGAWFSQMGLQFRWNDFGNGAAWNLASVDGQVDGWSGSNGGGALVFYTKTLGPYATDPTEKMRINAAGALCLGTTTPYGTNLLNVNGSIYSTGNIAAVVAADVDLFTFISTSASYTKSCFVGSIAAAGSTSSYYFYGQQSTSSVSLKIFTNGNIQNTNNSYGAISDARLKENIIDATPKLEDLMKVKVRNYNLKGESNKQLGVISQELEEIFPNMIEESTNIGENVKIKGVKYSVFVPMLIKAVQELKAEIETLKNK